MNKLRLQSESVGNKFRHTQSISQMLLGITSIQIAFEAMSVFKHTKYLHMQRKIPGIEFSWTRHFATFLYPRAYCRVWTDYAFAPANKPKHMANVNKRVKILLDKMILIL